VAEALGTRGGRLQGARFASRLVRIGLGAFFRYNRRVPVATLLRWRRALRPAYLVSGEIRGTRSR
jgi:hypothetical protein